jgi:hypothetical protein
MLEQIALSCDDETLLTLRLTNREIEKRTFVAFEKKFLTNMIWDGGLHPARVHSKVEGLKIRPNFARRVQQLDFEFNDYENLALKKMNKYIEDIQILHNLVSVQFRGFAEGFGCLWEKAHRFYLI